VRTEQYHRREGLEELDLCPWRTEAFRFFTDPGLDVEVRDVVGRI
jgi:hypothetical protein